MTDVASSSDQFIYHCPFGPNDCQLTFSKAESLKVHCLGEHSTKFVKLRTRFLEDGFEKQEAETQIFELCYCKEGAVPLIYRMVAQAFEPNTDPSKSTHPTKAEVAIKPPETSEDAISTQPLSNWDIPVTLEALCRSEEKIKVPKVHHRLKGKPKHIDNARNRNKWRHWETQRREKLEKKLLKGTDDRDHLEEGEID